MKITCEKKEGSMISITLTIPVSEHQPYLEKAAQNLSKKLKVNGFRAGHIPYDVVVKEAGEMNILELATEDMIKKGLIQAIKEHNLETIGQPDVKIKKLVPGNDVEVDVEWAQLPSVKLPDLETISIEQKTIMVDDTEVEKTLEEIQKMRASEAATTEAATQTDRVVVDMEMLNENVPLEGGTTKDHSIFLSEEGYIPGITQELLGVKKGDTKEFELEIPKTHYSKLIAGKKITFKVTIKDVFKRTLAELDDEFAKGLGAKDISDLKELLKTNIERDKQTKEEERATGEMIDTIIEKSIISDIPNILIESEKQRLFAEFKQHLDDQGIALEQYLSDIKKTVEEVAEGFNEQADKKTRASLVYRELAKQENIEIDDKELELEKEQVRSSYQEYPNIEEKLKDPDIIDYITVNLRNRKLTQLLKERLIKKPEPDKKEESQTK